MNKVKLRTKVFRISFIILFAIFITVFISNKYGYYEYQKHEQVTLTQEQIKQFEQDVKDGKEVDLENYLANTNKNLCGILIIIIILVLLVEWWVNCREN